MDTGGAGSLPAGLAISGGSCRRSSGLTRRVGGAQVEGRPVGAASEPSGSSPRRPCPRLFSQDVVSFPRPLHHPPLLLSPRQTRRLVPSTRHGSAPTGRTLLVLWGVLGATSQPQLRQDGSRVPGQLPLDTGLPSSPGRALSTAVASGPWRLSHSCGVPGKDWGGVWRMRPWAPVGPAGCVPKWSHQIRGGRGRADAGPSPCRPESNDTRESPLPTPLLHAFWPRAS